MCIYIYIYIYSCSTGAWPYPDLSRHGKKSLMQSSSLAGQHLLHRRRLKLSKTWLRTCNGIWGQRISKATLPMWLPRHHMPLNIFQFCNERSISSDFFVWMSRSLGIEQILSSQAAQGLHSNHDKPSSQQVRKDFQVFDKSLSKLKRGLIYIITSGLSSLRVSLIGHVAVPVPDKHNFSCWGSGRNAHE